MKRLYFLFIALLSISAAAQTTQSGYVQEYNEKAKKTPISGVELRVRSANSTVSDEAGQFSLQFLTLKPGEKVNVRRIEKLGYEIFNKEAVEQWNINPQNPFIIVMCRSDKFKAIRDNYEKVSSASYARQLEKEQAELKALKTQGKIKEAEYQKQLAEIQENYDKQLDNLGNYIDRFARIDLSELSAVEQEIIELVQQGRIEQAIAKYEQQNYLDKYKQEVAQLKEVSTAIDQLTEIKTSKEQSRDSILAAIDRQIETLRLAGGKENFDKIEVILKEIAFSDSTNFNNIYKYGSFLEEQNLHIHAIPILEKACAISNNTLEKTKAVTALANALMYNSQLQQAEKLIVEFSSQLSDKTIDVEQESSLSYTLARILYKSTRFEEANNILLNILSKLDSETTVPLLGSVYYTLSSLNRTLKNFDTAIIYGNKALHFYESQNNLNRNNPQISQCLENIAKIHYYSKDIQSALVLFNKLNDFYQESMKDNPARFSRNYAWN